MTGFLFTTVVVIIVALIAFRVGPSYIEYFTVQKALDQTMLEVQNPTIAEIKPYLKDVKGVKINNPTVTGEFK